MCLRNLNSKCGAFYRNGTVDVTGPGPVVIRAAFEVRSGGGVLQVDAAAVQCFLAGVAEPNLKYISFLILRSTKSTYLSSRL
jgi:hypothetical protein